MFGIRFIKVQPTTYLMQYQHGKVVREGSGLSFFYFAPHTSLIAIPMESTDVPFMFEETTADHQKVTAQGVVTYRVSEPARLAQCMNFMLHPSGGSHASDDPDKLPQRVVHFVHVLAQAELQKLPLRQAILAAEGLALAIQRKLEGSKEVQSLGLEILALSVLAIKPTPDTARALEAQTREQILKEADEAIYARRGSAIEQERAIKENELNTEIAVENKKREIREAQMEAERAIQEKRHRIEALELAARIKLEETRKDLVALAAKNAKAEADSRAYGISVSMNAFSGVDADVLQALASVGMSPEQLIALAFQELAEKASKIGQLNISPDLLQGLLHSEPRK